MKDLEELRGKMMSLPGRFAEALTNAQDIAPSSLGDDIDRNMSFKGGFSAPFSKNPWDYRVNGEFIQRNDANRFGEIASRESLFKQTGGEHFFSTEVVRQCNGYPKNCILGYYDGKCLIHVESQESDNVNQIMTEEGNYHSTWRPVDYIHGLDEDLFSIEFDYISAYPYTMTPIKQDSFIIGRLGIFGGYDAKFESTTTYNGGTINVLNKGKLSEEDGFIYIISIRFSPSTGMLTIKVIPMPVLKTSGGNANYSFPFFVKKGASVSCTYESFSNKKPVEWTVVPIRTHVG